MEEFLQLKNITKTYKNKEEVETKACQNININFPSHGLVFILGKSGSGKSTLLNMIGLIDKPDEGEIVFKGENILRYSSNKTNHYHLCDVGFIFQHYHLLEKETVLFNITLPLLIAGYSQKKSKEKALELFSSVGLDKSFYKRKCQSLSGGEKQRVVILRSIINEPSIVLADEATGALDSENSRHVMDILQKISTSRLVIMVTHNLSLVEQYADRVIEIGDGKIISDNLLHQSKQSEEINKEIKKIKRDNWSQIILGSHLLKNYKRNIVVTLSLMIGVSFSFLLIGFNNGKDKAINDECLKHPDYGVSVVEKEITTNVTSSGLSVIRTTRPSESDIQEITDKYPFLIIEPNIDALLPPSINISIGDSVIDSLTYYPVYSFASSNTISEVYINQAGYEYLKDELHYSPLGLKLNLSYQYQNHHYVDDEVITDYFVFESTVTITQVVEEMSFLSTPKIYYSYVAMEEYLSSYIMNNVSSYLNEDISWLEYISAASNSSSITSYSYRIFCPEYYYDQLEDIKNSIASPLVINNTAITIKETLNDFISAACIGLDIYLVIAIIGTILIMGIISFASYMENIKESAILCCLGAKQDKIMEIYITENLIIGLSAITISIFLLPWLTKIGNYLIKYFVGLNNAISLSLFVYPYMEIWLSVVAVSLTAIMSIYLPIKLNKKISIRKELAEND